MFFKPSKTPRVYTRGASVVSVTAPGVPSSRITLINALYVALLLLLVPTVGFVAAGVYGGFTGDPRGFVGMYEGVYAWASILVFLTLAVYLARWVLVKRTFIAEGDESRWHTGLALPEESLKYLDEEDNASARCRILDDFLKNYVETGTWRTVPKNGKIPHAFKDPVEGVITYDKTK